MNEDERVRVIAENAMKWHLSSNSATWNDELAKAKDAIAALEAAGYYVGRLEYMGDGYLFRKVEP